MEIDKRNKKDKWTIMKYVKDFDLILEYASVIRDLKARIDSDSIIEINSTMEELGIYVPRFGKPSIDTTNFKICQIVYFLIAYKSNKGKKELVFSPLGNLLLDNRENAIKKAKIISTMLYGLPFSHPYNKMSFDFDLYPFRLVFKLLLDKRLNQKLYLDDLFYCVFWKKTIDTASYEELVKEIVKLRSLSYTERIAIYKSKLSLEDTLANALHEAKYLFGQLHTAGIVNINEGIDIDTLYHGGFGRNLIPDYLPESELEKINRTGKRTFTTAYISIIDELIPYINTLLKNYDFSERPHDILEKLDMEDYILQLYNFYPNELIIELGLNQKRISNMLKLSNSINQLSKNQNIGDCYKFEIILMEAFNEFEDVVAKNIGGAGNTDIECIYLTLDEKFAVEAKSTNKKLASINAGRLQLHRKKIKAKYTIIVAPFYTPSVESDINNSMNVLITASSLANYLYQATIHTRDSISYEPLYNIVKENFGHNISSFVNDYVALKFGIGG